MKKKTPQIITATALFSAAITAAIISDVFFQSEKTAITGHGNPAVLHDKYDAWKKRYEQTYGTEVLSVPMTYSRALLGTKNNSQGIAKLNLLTGEFNTKFLGLAKDQAYAIWMIGHSTADHNTKIEKKLGQFTVQPDATYRTQLQRQELAGFSLERFVLTQAGQNSAAPALIAGSPNLFQRIYFSNQLWAATTVGKPVERSDKPQNSFHYLLPKPAFAANNTTDLAATFADQIAFGRELFINETFDGNRRTCSTCHREDNNHTIDPNYIAKLKQSDPLFVHETNLELADLENANLVRQLALFQANIDGFDKPAVYRSAQHTLSLSLSMDKELPEKDPEVEFCEAMLGWSGDGSPGCGSLRMFSVGAIIQHMPKSLDRIENRDFRLPTDDELDALEAYLLSLGRQDPWVLENMTFTSPIVEAGKELFHSKPDDDAEVGTGECKGCHFQAGAISSSTLASGNRNTGVEALPNQLHHLLANDLPIDGGFGGTEHSDCGPDSSASCYGNKKFNMVDAFRVDTAPFFHNHAITTIEEAVSFYNSDAFNEADDRVIKMESSTVVAIAQFLRALSAVDNIDTVVQLLSEAHHPDLSKNRRRELISLAIADTEDAIEVLTQGQINAHPLALKWLGIALKKEKFALKKWHNRRRSGRLMTSAIRNLEITRDQIVTETH